MNKRGQFYLIAAMILIGVVFGFYATRNYISSVDEGDKIYDISNEIKEEGSRVIDYGIYNDEDKISEFMKEVSEDYLDEKAQDITFVYGDKDNLKIKRFEEKIYATSSIAGININAKKKIDCSVDDCKIDPVLARTENIKVTLDDKNYEFDLKSGEYFYIIIEKEDGNEKYIETA